MDSSPSTHFGNLAEQSIRDALLPDPQPPDVATILTDKLPIVMRHKNAAVLVPLIKSPQGWQVLMTRRTNTVKDHKGVVSFPGGLVEPDDTGPADTATREAWEEIGLPRGETRVLGYLENLVEINGLTVTPVIGVIPWPFEVRHSENEVYRTFTIPLDWLADEKNYRNRHFDDRENPAMARNVVFYDEFDGETVWGLTAYIMICLVHWLRRQKLNWCEVYDHVQDKI